MEHISKYKILLVDDNVIFLKALRMQVMDTMQGMVDSVDLAHNGCEAIARVKEKNYSIVFMDIDMPKMNGIDATKYINSNFPKVVVVALSMHNEYSIIEKMLQAGSRTYITKDNLDEDVIKNVFYSLDKYFVRN